LTWLWCHGHGMAATTHHSAHKLLIIYPPLPLSLIIGNFAGCLIVISFLHNSNHLHVLSFALPLWHHLHELYNCLIWCAVAMHGNLLVS
jgi:hypothetical protein